MDWPTQLAISDLTGTMHTVASAMSGELGSELGLALFSPTNMRKVGSTVDATLGQNTTTSFTLPTSILTCFSTV